MMVHLRRLREDLEAESLSRALSSINILVNADPVERVSIPFSTHSVFNSCIHNLQKALNYATLLSCTTTHYCNEFTIPSKEFDIVLHPFERAFDVVQTEVPPQPRTQHRQPAEHAHAILHCDHNQRAKRDERRGIQPTLPALVERIARDVEQNGNAVAQSKI